MDFYREVCKFHNILCSEKITLCLFNRQTCIKFDNKCEIKIIFFSDQEAYKVVVKLITKQFHQFEVHNVRLNK